MNDDRSVTIDGARNFRDFGGYAAASGRTVRWSRLYRSGHLADLTSDGLAQLSALQLNLICDLRAPREHEVNPSALSGTLASVQRQLPVDIGAFNRFSDAIRDRIGREELAALVHKLLTQTNQRLVLEYSPVFREMFAALLQTDGAVLIHCTGGRDRTGVAAALILCALGVSRELILQDYVLSNRFLEPALFATWFREHADIDLPAEDVAPIAYIAAAHLQAAFDVVDHEFGGTDTYLREAMALDDAAFAALHNRFLTPE